MGRTWMSMLFVGACVFLPSPSAAQVVQAIATINANCFAQTVETHDNFISSENIIQQACIAEFANGFVSAQSVADVKALFVSEPFVDVLTHAVNNNGSNGGVRVNATATLTYVSNIRLQRAPPFTPPGWPLTLRARYGLNLFGPLRTSQASASLKIVDFDGLIFFNDIQELIVGEARSGTYDLQASVEADAPFTITIEAVCSSHPGRNEETSCQAVMDPLIEFDQATFDALHGANSFILADFLTIEQSPNLVPEPGLAALSGTALIALVILRLSGIARERHAR